MRQRLYEIVEPANDDDKASRIYDTSMMLIIVASLVPLAFKQTTPFLLCLDYIAVAIFIADYIVRLITADFKLHKGGVSLLLYPFTPLAIIDLLCILPSFNIISGSFRILKVLRMFRCFRVFKLFRYSKNMQIIATVIKKEKGALLTVCFLAIGYIIVSALVIFNVEPDSFDNFFDALYWATVSLTTMGYGDIYPVTDIGRCITMVSSLLGIAVVALPAGIITAGYMRELGE